MGLVFLFYLGGSSIKEVYYLAALFHDFCYKYAIYNKAWADYHFYLLGLETNKDKKGLAQKIVRIKCLLAYWAVSLFGKGNYK